MTSKKKKKGKIPAITIREYLNCVGRKLTELLNSWPRILCSRLQLIKQMKILTQRGPGWNAEWTHIPCTIFHVTSVTNLSFKSHNIKSQHFAPRVAHCTVFIYMCWREIQLAGGFKLMGCSRVFRNKLTHRPIFPASHIFNLTGEEGKSFESKIWLLDSDWRKRGERGEADSGTRVLKTRILTSFYNWVGSYQFARIELLTWIGLQRLAMPLPNATAIAIALVPDTMHVLLPRISNLVKCSGFRILALV